MISKLTIDGFKVFEQFELPRLSRITIIGGKNNIGKTTVLEALFMLYDLNPEMLIRQYNRRGLSTIPLTTDSMMAPVFNNYDINRQIVVSAEVDGSEEKMSVRYNPRYFPPGIPAIITDPSSKNSLIRTDQKSIPSSSLDITYGSKDGVGQNVHLFMTVNNIGLVIDGTPTINRPEVSFIPARAQVSPKEDADRFGRLDIKGRLDEIISFLKIIEPNLKSLSSIPISDGSLVFGDIGLIRKIPVLHMGDGMARLLTIILSIATCENSFVLIDECENGIHFSVMPRIWKAIALAAQKFNCQVICTTHSDECIRAAHEGISEEAIKNDLSYVRLDKVQDRTVAKVFDYKQLAVAIETNMEIR